MKEIVYLILLALSIISIACKKENKDNAISINGYWTGTGKDDSSSDIAPMNFLFKEGNIARAYILNTDTTASVNGNGTYSIDPDSVRTLTVIAGKTIIFSGKLNSTNDQMSGKYINTTTTVVGSFTVTKN